jgi:threonine/homoserine/homoserine lactone efflux protein
MGLLLIFATSYGLSFSGAIMPGPLFTATVSESAKRGFIAGPLLILGHALLELVLVCALLLGLSELMKANLFVIIVSLVGGVVMLGMAASMALGIPRLTLAKKRDAGDAGIASEKPRRGDIVLAGLVISLSNPYFFIWWATIGVGYLGSCLAFGIPGVIVFYVAHILGDATWYSGISLLIAGGKRWLNDLRYRILVGACAGLIAYFGVSFAIEGIKRIIGV